MCDNLVLFDPLAALGRPTAQMNRLGTYSRLPSSFVAEGRSVWWQDRFSEKDKPSYLFFLKAGFWALGEDWLSNRSGLSTASWSMCDENDCNYDCPQEISISRSAKSSDSWSRTDSMWNS
eukprot:4741878-Prymnesium_polylepis.1